MTLEESILYQRFVSLMFKDLFQSITEKCDIQLTRKCILHKKKPQMANKHKKLNVTVSQEMQI